MTYVNFSRTTNTELARRALWAAPRGRHHPRHQRAARPQPAAPRRRRAHQALGRRRHAHRHAA